MNKCIDHLHFAGKICEDCNLPVDFYGNTEGQFENCSFPDCGCDGERLCMAGEASEYARAANVEGMWSGKTEKQREAVSMLVGDLKNAEKFGFR